MKTGWLPLPLLPIIFTATLVVLLYVPIMSDGNWSECDGTRCVNVVQCESISYKYGGWGGVYVTGVNHYRVDVWTCFCPSNAANCCVPPFQALIFVTASVLLTADLSSIFLAVQRKYGTKHKDG